MPAASLGLKSRAKPRIFPRRPGIGDPFVQKFLEHVRRTGEPETFEGLDLGPIGSAEKYEKVADVDINPRRRTNGDWAYCPICDHNNKYLHGDLVWFLERKTLASIGNECSDRGNRVASDNEYKARNRKNQEEDYLLENVRFVQSQIVAIERTLPIAETARALHRHFRSNGSLFQRQLRDVKKNGGQLIVTEQLTNEFAGIGPSGFQSRGAGETRDRSFGLLLGQTAVIATFDPVADLDRIIRTIAPYAQYRTQDDALEFVAGLDSQPEERYRVYVELSEAKRQYQKVRERLVDFASFFSPTNVNRIARWAAHAEHPSPFEASITRRRGLRGLELKCRTHRFFAVLEPALFEPIPVWPQPEE